MSLPAFDDVKKAVLTLQQLHRSFKRKEYPTAWDGLVEGERCALGLIGAFYGDAAWEDVMSAMDRPTDDQ